MAETPVQPGDTSTGGAGKQREIIGPKTPELKRTLQEVQPLHHIISRNFDAMVICISQD